MDTDLQKRLETALHDGLQRDVDVQALISAAHRDAGRIRRRRRVVGVTVGLALVASAPVALGQLPASGERAATASLTGSGPQASTQGPLLVTPTTDDLPPGDDALQRDALDTGPEGSVAVPDEALLTGEDLTRAGLPFGGEPELEIEANLRLRTLGTSLCGDGPEPGDELVVGGRERGWYQGNDSVSTTVRVFDGNGASKQLAFLRESMGSCDYAGQVFEPLSVDGLPGDDAVLGVGSGSGYLAESTVVVGAVRAGRSTVGVNLLLDVPREEAVEVARELVVRAERRLTESAAVATDE